MGLSGTVPVALIAAVAENGAIGMAGGLPWHISGDLKFFKAKTLGKPVIMGRKTYDSIGKPLPGRPNIVITRNASFAAEGVESVGDLESAMTLAGSLALDSGAAEIMVIGGAEIYAQAMPFAGRLYITEVAAAPEGDAFFPKIEKAAWRESFREAHEGGDGPDYCFVILDRAA